MPAMALTDHNSLAGAVPSTLSPSVFQLEQQRRMPISTSTARCISGATEQTRVLEGVPSLAGQLNGLHNKLYTGADDLNLHGPDVRSAVRKLNSNRDVYALFHLRSAGDVEPAAKVIAFHI